MRRVGLVLLVIAWTVVFVRVMTVDACCTDPIARLVAVGFLMVTPATVLLRERK